MKQEELSNAISWVLLKLGLLRTKKRPRVLLNWASLAFCLTAATHQRELKEGRGEGGEGRWESGHNYIYFMTDCECVNVHGTLRRKREGRRN